MATFLYILADAVPPDLWDKLIAMIPGTGVAGIVLGYYLWKLDPRLKAIELALDRASKTDLLRLAASPHVAPELKEVAKQMLDEIKGAGN